MSIGYFNTYQITHKNGKQEELNATSLDIALNNLQVKDAQSPILSLTVARQGIRTVIDPTDNEVDITATVDPADATTCKVIPSSTKATKGTDITLVAVPAEGYVFNKWQIAEKDVGTGVILTYTVPADLETGATLEIKALFTAKPKKTITASVSPANSGDVIPASTVAYIGDTVKLVAVEASNYTFKEWLDPQNTPVSGAGKVLTLSITASTPAEQVYKAVFEPVTASGGAS